MSSQNTQKLPSSHSIHHQSIELRESAKSPQLIENLGWTETEAKESYYRLKTLEDDWTREDMSVYDEL